MTESDSENRLSLWKERWSKSKGDPSWHKVNVSKHLLKYLDVLQNGKTLLNASTQEKLELTQI